MNCCFIGHKKITITNELKSKLNRILIVLINRYKVDTFLFGDRSEFNDFSLDVVKTLKNIYPYIKIIKYPSNDWYKGQEKENVEFNKIVLKNEIIDFDEYVYLNYYGKFSYVQRNEKMIMDSDYCVFYYNKNYVAQHRYKIGVARKSGTQVAFDFAKKHKKKIVNLFVNEINKN